MRKSVVLAALLAALLLCACGSHGGAELSVYRAVAPYYRTDGSLIEAETVTVPPGVGALNTAVSVLNTQPADPRLQSSLPGDVRILSYQLSAGVLTLTVSPGYAALSGMDKSLADCCLALTFCGMEGVDYLAVSAGGETVTAPLSPADIILSDTTA